MKRFWEAQRSGMIICKSLSELEKMRASGRLVAQILDHLTAMVQPGVTTMDLEETAERMVDEAGARAAFKGYFVPAAGRRFPCVLCTSVNEEVVHGIPSKKRKLAEGDIVKIDIGVQLGGYFGDSATTVRVGAVDAETDRLLQITKEALDLGIEQARAGNRLFDISGAVQRHVESSGFTIVREFVGHGIGAKLHEEPQVPNYVDRKIKNPRLREGMVLAIEPMVAAGQPETHVLADRWTAVTRDGSRAAHFEHCVAITDNGPWVLTTN